MYILNIYCNLYRMFNKSFMSILRILLFFCLLINGHATAQRFKFETGLTWLQILKKAKEENKYIFVDCYTTWCSPCRTMDREVYTNDSVADFFNEKFISVKMQMDKTEKDNQFVKNSYPDAEFIEKKYRIRVYPSYLFFSSDGALVHKDNGLKQPNDFIAVAQTALRPGKVYHDPFSEYERLMFNYKKGKKNYYKLPYMITKARDAGEWTIMNKLIKDYYGYLKTQPERALYSKENLQLIADLLQSSKDMFFHLFFPNGNKANDIVSNRFFASKVVDKVIMHEEVDPMLGEEASMTGVSQSITPQVKDEPNWDKLYTIIKNKYGWQYAKRNVLSAKVKWYGNYHRWPEWIAANIEKVETFGIDTTTWNDDVMLNGIAWQIFLLSDDSTQINIAVKWIKGVARRKCCMPMGPVWDTYANLLHKAGRTDEALKWEQKALKEAEERNDKQNIKLFRLILNTMQKGKPTWKNYNSLVKQAFVGL